MEDNIIIILIKGQVQLYMRQHTLFARSVLALAFSNNCTILLYPFSDAI